MSTVQEIRERHSYGHGVIIPNAGSRACDVCDLLTSLEAAEQRGRKLEAALRQADHHLTCNEPPDVHAAYETIQAALSAPTLGDRA